jgi:hypothetical protein
MVGPDIEVFSPGIHTQLKARWASLVRAAASRQRLQSRLLRAGSRQAAIDARWHMGLACSYASLRRPQTANPGEKTSLVLVVEEEGAGKVAPVSLSR